MCPVCSAPVMLGDGVMLSAPKMGGLEWTGAFVADRLHRTYRVVVSTRWWGCTACEWCGPTNEVVRS